MSIHFKPIEERFMSAFGAGLWKTIGAAALVLALASPSRAAVEIQEVTTESGITAWLVEDYTIPMIAINFSFGGGTNQDPDGKSGLVNLMSGLFDEGAGDLEANDFQEALDNAGAEMSFNASSDALYGQMRLLSDNKDEALDLLALAINETRFDAGPVERIRQQILTGIRASSRDPQQQGNREFARVLYGDHPYARENDGTEADVTALTVEDLQAAHGRLLAKSNLNVAVVGAIDAETLRADLERIFGALPQEAALTEVPRVEPKLGEEVFYDFQLPQSTVQLVYPGMERDDPEFFAAYLMNHILGGGTFSSRLFNEVREVRGLTYGIGSWLANRDYSSSLAISTSTRSDQVGQALDVIGTEVEKLVEDGPTADELEKAKTYVIGAYAINNLDSSASIARTLLELQRDDLGIDYIDTRVGQIEAVTLDQVKAAAQRLLTAEPSVLVIGPRAEETETSN
ncbi:M16 family metallopeptidase [Aliihoeflea sp. PC F10.4]